MTGTPNRKDTPPGPLGPNTLKNRRKRTNQKRNKKLKEKLKLQLESVEDQEISQLEEQIARTGQQIEMLKQRRRERLAGAGGGQMPVSGSRTGDNIKDRLGARRHLGNFPQRVQLQPWTSGGPLGGFKG